MFGLDLNVKARSTWLVGLCCSVLGGVAALLVGHGEPLPPAGAAHHATAAPPTIVQAAPIDLPTGESSLMNRLRMLGESDPATTLSLAQAGNEFFPNGASAAERGWMICKSLVNQQRFSEAVAAARIVVERYPNTPWATDVQRHLLVNPMTDPSERGYGHQLEIE